MHIRDDRRKNDITLSDVEGDRALFRFCQEGLMYELEPRTVLCKEGETADRLFLLIEGSVQVHTSVNDNDLCLTYLTGLNIFGEMGWLGQETRRSATIKSRTACRVVEMTYDQFEDFRIRYPDILKTLCSHMARRLKATSGHYVSMAFDDVTDRVIDTIYEMTRIPDAASHPDGVLIKVTRQEIGNMLGCSRETIGRVIKMLEDRKLLSTRGKSIVIRTSPEDHA